MNAERNYTGQSRNWIYARDYLELQRRLRDKQIRKTRNDSYYGGVPYWMNGRQRHPDAPIASHCLIVNKLDTPPMPELSVSRVKHQFRVTKSTIKPRSVAKSVGTIQRAPPKVTVIIGDRRKEASQPVLVSQHQSPVVLPDSRVSSTDQPESDVYLPVPRILYEVQGSSY